MHPGQPDQALFNDLSFIDAQPVADAGMTDDAAPPTVDELCLEPPAPPAQTPLALAARCRGAGEPLRIRDLRDLRCEDAPIFRDSNGDGMSDDRVDVSLSNVVVVARYEDDFVVQDRDGGTYSGLWVFGERNPPGADVVPGAVVSLEGQLMEYYSLTELQLISEGPGITVTGQAAVPAPIYVAEPSRIADGGDLTEALESVLVEIKNVQVHNTAPDCPRDFDMFVVNGGLRIEDEVELVYEPSRGDLIESAIGVLHYSFEHQKIIPRSDADIRKVHCGGIPDKCDATECVVEVSALETGELVITEIQDDPRGPDGPREFVELYNPGPSSINLNGWWLQDCSDRRVDLSGQLAAGRYHVIAGDRRENENGGVDADGELGEIQIPNGSGSLLVFNASSQLVDQVRYDDEAPWPRRETGQSLELTSHRADNGNGAVWRAG